MAVSVDWVFVDIGLWVTANWHKADKHGVNRVSEAHAIPDTHAGILVLGTAHSNRITIEQLGCTDAETKHLVPEMPNYSAFSYLTGGQVVASSNLAVPTIPLLVSSTPFRWIQGRPLGRNSAAAG